MVDSSDRDRIDEARDELHKALNEVELERVKVLVLANKQDLPQAMPAAEVSERLQLKDIKDKPWYIQVRQKISTVILIDLFPFHRVVLLFREMVCRKDWTGLQMLLWARQERNNVSNST